ncbi:MAG TPA: hypothetical protein VLH61_05375 [Bacteroidales bacterium]|nr:hypothetical protein [Bacteroidales bacterium]
MKNLRPDLILLLLIVFVGASVWMSFELRSGRQSLLSTQAELKSAGQEKAMLLYRLSKMQEALEVNIGYTPKAMLLELPGNASAPELFPLLYLRAYACSPCIMPAIRHIAPYIRRYEHFRIIAHPSNRPFLVPLFGRAAYAGNGDLIWHNGKLYEYGPVQYEAELLFVHPKYGITGVLPLDLLNDANMFELVRGMLGRNPVQDQ